MKIVIIGGGSAGWLAASMFLKNNGPNVDIVVVESSKIGIIGAGEGSTGSLPMYINESWTDSSINEISFLKKTKATLKLAINLKNWRGDGESYFSTILPSPTANALQDDAFLTSIVKNGTGDFASMNTLLLKDGLTTYNKKFRHGIPHNFPHSYHFDGHELGKFFKEFCLKKGARIIDSEVDTLEFDDTEYLKSVTLINGNKLEADLFIDSSGFSKVLMSKTKNKWISYKEYLPCNSAIPFSEEIHSKVVRFETLAETMNAGWMWKIPLQHRYGSGYVYCDEFQSYEKCIEELETKLRKEIKPNKHIKFEAGRYENCMYNNILSLGLSSHFLEPLQATSIHITLMSLQNFIYTYFKSVECIKSDINRSKFNNSVNRMIDDYKDLIQMHYLSGRQDTPFWKFVKNELTITDRNKEKIEIAKYRALHILDFENMHGVAGWGVWSHICDMAGLYDKNILSKELDRYDRFRRGEAFLKSQIDEYKRIKPTLATAAELFKYLKI
jgi:tryptophan halogenase